jgi:crossover junction endodeoxyribonuclease RuvC
MSFLGIDPSITALALQHFYNGLIGAQQINTSPKDFPSYTARLDFILSEFRRCLLAIQEVNPIRLAAIEGFSYGSVKSGMTQVMITAAAAGVRLELYRAGVPFVEVPPSTLKKWISGKGNAEKNLMLREVYKRWGYDAKDDNDADAHALVRLAEQLSADPQPQTEHWKSIIKACPRTEARL